MLRKPFRVARSYTGLGLFATDVIEKGEFIVEYKGRWLRNGAADALADRGSKYLYEINSRWTVDGSSRRNVARYANHSCRPNAESDVTRDRKIIIRAIKKIRPGDEITYDYGKDYFNIIIRPIGCQCARCLEKRREERLLKRAKAMRRNGRK
jgi:SET domain-containing protein